MMTSSETIVLMLHFPKTSRVAALGGLLFSKAGEFVDTNPQLGFRRSLGDNESLVAALYQLHLGSMADMEIDKCAKISHGGGKFTQSESYRNQRSVPGVSTHGRHSDYRVSKCRCGIHLLMCDGNSRWNSNRNGNRSRGGGTGYCNLYRCHHKL